MTFNSLPNSQPAVTSTTRFVIASSAVLRHISSIVGLSALGVFALLVAPKFQTIVAVVVILFGGIKILIRKVFLVKKQTKRIGQPPRQLLFVAALFLPSSIRDSALGDMEEIYARDFDRLGGDKFASIAANCLMLKDVLCSNFPLLRYFVRRIVLQAFKAIGLYEIYRRFIG